MLDILNPCHCPDAWWQQLLMLLGPLVLGYLWAKSGSSNVDTDDLSARLTSLDADLADCQSKTNMAEMSLKAKSVAPVAVAATVANSITPTSKSKKDDLKVVEGIGPKIEELFNNAGILTFEQLASAPAEKLKEILVAAGSRYQMHDPTTWPSQSKLADEGKWEELKKWQDELNKGTAS